MGRLRWGSPKEVMGVQFWGRSMGLISGGAGSFGSPCLQDLKPDCLDRSYTLEEKWVWSMAQWQGHGTLKEVVLAM